MIDFKKETITGASGKVYKIAPDRMSIYRYAQFELHQSLTAFNMSYQELINKIVAIKEAVSGPLTGQGLSNANAFCNEIIEYVVLHPNAESIPRVVAFCSIFCIEEGEDLTTYTDELVRSKYEDWKHIPFQDFFLLWSNVIPKFLEDFNRLNQNETEQ